MKYIQAFHLEKGSCSGNCVGPWPVCLLSVHSPYRKACLQPTHEGPGLRLSPGVGQLQKQPPPTAVEAHTTYSDQHVTRSQTRVLPGYHTLEDTSCKSRAEHEREGAGMAQVSDPRRHTDNPGNRKID